MNIKDVTQKYRCDKCKAEFEGKDVQLKPYNMNVFMPLASLILVSGDGTLVCSSGRLAEETDQTLNCPECGELHLFGFEKV